MNPTVLLIEDNEANRYLATFLLEKIGCRVLHAHEGRTGLAMAAECGAALIVLDIQMPEMDGYEVAAALRSAPATKTVPILVVTSYAMAGDRGRAIALGVNDYLEKPYDPEEFVRRVRALLPTDSPA